MFFHALTFARSEGSSSPKGPGKCKCNETDMGDRYSCFLPDSSLKLHRKCLKVIKIITFCMLNLIVQNGVNLQNQMSMTSFPLHSAHLEDF